MQKERKALTTTSKDLTSYIKFYYRCLKGEFNDCDEKQLLNEFKYYVSKSDCRVADQEEVVNYLYNNVVLKNLKQKQYESRR